MIPVAAGRKYSSSSINNINSKTSMRSISCVCTRFNTVGFNYHPSFTDGSFFTVLKLSYCTDIEVILNVTTNLAKSY